MYALFGVVPMHAALIGCMATLRKQVRDNDPRGSSRAEYFRSTPLYIANDDLRPSKPMIKRLPAY